MRWARHWDSMRRLVWEPEDAFERLWQIGEINEKLVICMKVGKLLPGESSTGDWLRLLRIDELLIIHAFADLYLHSLVASRLSDHPKIEDFLVLLITLVELEKGPLYRRERSIEAHRTLGLRLLCATHFEVLARKGYLQIDDAIQLMGSDDGASMSLKVRVAADRTLVMI